MRGGFRFIDHVISRRAHLEFGMLPHHCTVAERGVCPTHLEAAALRGQVRNMQVLMALLFSGVAARLVSI